MITTLEFDDTGLQALLDLLGRLPYAEVAGLIATIQARHHAAMAANALGGIASAETRHTDQDPECNAESASQT